MNDHRLIQCCFVCLIWLTCTGVSVAVEGQLPPKTSLNSGSSGQVSPKVWCNRSFTSDTPIDVVRTMELDWYLVDSGHITHSLRQNPIWCQFRVSVNDRKHWYFGVSDPHVQNLQVYFDGMTEPAYETGSGFSFNQRPIENRFFYFSLPSNPSNDILIHLRFKSLILNAPIRLMTEDSLSARAANRQSLSALSLGLLMPLLAALIATRKMSGRHRYSLRLWSAAIVASYIFTSTSVQGYGYQYFWGNAPNWNQISGVITATLGVSVLWKYLDTLCRRDSIGWNRIFTLSITLTAASCFAFLFFKHVIYFQTAVVLFIWSSVFMLIRHIQFILTKPSILQSKLWLVWILLVGATLLQWLGIINFKLEIELVITCNFFMLTALLGWDLFRLIKTNQQKLITALEETVIREQQIAQLEYEKNNQLEKQVEERTKELARMMRELHISNMRLRTASNTDALTGIMNRYAVDRYLEEQWARCIARQESLAVAYIDADHFKKVNDAHGHSVGDDCLVQLARMITNSMTNPSMRVARYGGEEFIVIAPTMTSDNLYNLLENLRGIIEETPIISGDLQFHITISIGIASTLATSETSYHDIVKHADSALYQAKSGGRNQVVCHESERL
jgi:diguanylate cyclase (GGDEF)-like protein